MTKWVASEYLDNGKWGVLTENNEIVVGISSGLSREECQRLAKRHNEGEYVALPEPKSGQAGKTLGQLAYEAYNTGRYGERGWEYMTEYEQKRFELAAAAAVREKDERIAELEKQLEPSDHCATHCPTLLGKSLQEQLKDKDGEIARLQKPWSVVMSLGFDGDGYEQVDCNILDVGHADRILLVETPQEVKALLIALRQKDEQIKVLEAENLKLLNEMMWLDLHTSFVADYPYSLGPFKRGELRLLAQAGLAAMPDVPEAPADHTSNPTGDGK